MTDTPRLQLVTGGREVVLVVDDQYASRELLTALVGRLESNPEVQPFATVREALEFARSTTVDLVLMDYRMPDIDGVSAIKALRELDGYEDVPMIMVTVHGERALRQQAWEAGVHDFIDKPIDVFETMIRCRNLLRWRRLAKRNHPGALDERH